jgi:RHS repeat-associated protein
MLSNKIHQNSMDAGERWLLTNVAGNLIHGWDSLQRHTKGKYDELQRPTELRVLFEDTGTEILAEKMDYGEDQTNDKALNLRDKVYQVFDGAGVVTNAEYDFKGNLLRSTRQLLQKPKDQVDWAKSPAPVLENEIFTSSTTYDALNRPVTLTTPHHSNIPASVIRPQYNEANLLEQVQVNLRGAAPATAFVKNIDYNAKGQRELIEYDNGVTTTYEYDPLTFRLANLKTTRTTDGKKLQDLHYTYDPVGNITEIRDDAQKTIVTNNETVLPRSQYEYDAIYRLIAADGREHSGQNAQIDHTDFPPVIDPHPNDPQAMRNYTEQYEYDAVGNILNMIHKLGRLPNPGQTVWKRRYDYEANNNRLRSTSLPGDLDNTPLPERYKFDDHGNIITMPHLSKMEWDFKDQLNFVERGTVKAYYVYDAAGQRVRKVVEKNNGALIEERIYLGGFEIFRQRNGTGLTLERETLHIMDDQKRIALVETLTVEGGQPAPSNQRPATRFQLGNHLGSACLELDENGAVISYEEYHPYGTTSFQAGRSAAEVSLKRYRYTGKERDEESGLYYHGARYYAPHQKQTCHPAGVSDL